MKSKLIHLATVACAITALFPTGARAGDVTDSGTAGRDVSKNVTTSKPEQPTPLDLLNMDTDYTFASKMRPTVPRTSQDAYHLDFTYGHRIHITGQWYLRLGVEYERFDFGGSPIGVPDHLQAASATIAYEYVIDGYAGAAIELHPGFYFENNITGRNFDIPIDIYTGFPIIKDKLFGMIGFYEGQFITPAVYPIIGVIWLTSEKTRLEAIFPRPSYIYTPNDDWEFRLTGEVGGNGYRMDDTASTPASYRNSVLLYYYLRAGGKVTYSHWKPYTVALGGGWDFQREFDFFRDGVKYKAAPAPYINVSIGASF